MLNRIIRAVQKSNVIAQKGNVVEVMFMDIEEAKEFFECLSILESRPLET